MYAFLSTYIEWWFCCDSTKSEYPERGSEWSFK